MTTSKPLYFATDADIFDLIEPEIKRFSKTRLLELALRRGIILSPAEDRVDIIQFLSTLPFSQSQLQDLCDQIESPGRAQRTTSVRINTSAHANTFADTITDLQKARTDKDEQWLVTKKDDCLEIKVGYTELNHRKSSLRQRTENEVTLQVEPTSTGEYTIRHTANPKAKEIAEKLVQKLESRSATPIPIIPISLSGIVDRGARTKFWVELIKQTQGLVPYSVTKVGVCRDMASTPLGADAGEEDSEEDSESAEELLTAGLIHKAVFEGDEVFESAEFQNTQTAFFVYKASWLADSTSGDRFEIEAQFRDSAAAHQFVYIVKNVLRKKESGGFYKTSQRPSAGEIRELSRALEDSAHLIAAKLEHAFAIPVPNTVDMVGV
ncbi:hypothetical protein [Synechococcus sp. CCY 0621]|uniref:hypothetical protein n=1 Tax=Synechococcus sp. CCY 0621 TaxID=2815603 RepID=UPI001C225837|nr:hypothetical protein [Synechococcus sp. CCY 0621]